MQEQKGAKIGAFVFFCFGVMMLALGVWGITNLYDQGGIFMGDRTWIRIDICIDRNRIVY